MNKQSFNHLHPDASKSSVIAPNLICTLIYIAAAFILFGCAGIKTQINFEDNRLIGDAKIHGRVDAKLSTVQEFRSLLESLEYRVSEKAK